MKIAIIGVGALGSHLVQTQTALAKAAVSQILHGKNHKVQ